MIRVLSVDDNDYKQSAYKEICLAAGIDETLITVAKSAVEARKALSDINYDILILDIVLPNRIDNAPVENGGIELLQEIKENPNLRMPANIIVISKYENALERIADLTRETYFMSIKYEEDSEEWQLRLQSYLLQIIRSKDRKPEYNYYAAIICALRDPELSEVLKLPLKWVPNNELGDFTNYYIGELNGKRLICAAAHEMGMTATAVLATKMIQKFRPRYLLMTGIAAAIKRDNINFGDIIIADPCFDYGNGKWVVEDGKSAFKPSYRQIRLDARLLQNIELIRSDETALFKIRQGCVYPKPENNLKVHIGPLASGAAVIAESSIMEQVVKHERKLLGFDMESYAVMLSGERSDDPATLPIVLKSVSDFGDTEKSDDYQKYAAYTSAQLMCCLLNKLADADK